MHFLRLFFYYVIAVAVAVAVVHTHVNINFSFRREYDYLSHRTREYIYIHVLTLQLSICCIDFSSIFDFIVSRSLNVIFMLLPFSGTNVFSRSFDSDSLPVYLFHFIFFSLLSPIVSFYWIPEWLHPTE